VCDNQFGKCLAASLWLLKEGVVHSSKPKDSEMKKKQQNNMKNGNRTDVLRVDRLPCLMMIPILIRFCPRQRMAYLQFVIHYSAI